MIEKNIPEKIYIGRYNGDTELNEIDFMVLLKRGKLRIKLNSNLGSDIEYILNKQQRDDEYSNKDKKNLNDKEK